MWLRLKGNSWSYELWCYNDGGKILTRNAFARRRKQEETVETAETQIKLNQENAFSSIPTSKHKTGQGLSLLESTHLEKFIQSLPDQPVNQLPYGERNPADQALRFMRWSLVLVVCIPHESLEQSFNISRWQWQAVESIISNK